MLKIVQLIVTKSLSCIMPVLAIALLSFSSSCSSGRNAANDPITSDIRRNIKTGMTREEVITHLSKAGIEHHWSAERNVVQVLERDVEKDAVTTASNQIVIKFGSDNRVTSVEVNKVFTGP